MIKISESYPYNIKILNLVQYRTHPATSIEANSTTIFDTDPPTHAWSRSVLSLSHPLVKNDLD